MSAELEPDSDTGELPMSPASFFATEAMRWTLHGEAPKWISPTGLAIRHKIKDEIIVESALEMLAAHSLVVADVVGRFQLTPGGVASLHWAAPPADEYGAPWAAGLFRAIVAHHATTPTAALGAFVGSGVVARARLCYALHARGWSKYRIHLQFQIPAEQIEAGIARWKRRASSPRPNVAVRSVTA